MFCYIFATSTCKFCEFIGLRGESSEAAWPPLGVAEPVGAHVDAFPCRAEKSAPPCNRKFDMIDPNKWLI